MKSRSMATLALIGWLSMGNQMTFADNFNDVLYLHQSIPAIQLRPGIIIKQWVVNAAFNGGNSGGPLVQIETGEVFGVVSSKLAPITPTAASALQALENQKSGFQYSYTKPDGTTGNMSEGQVIGIVLNELRKQVQRVIGKAVILEDIRAFLTTNKLDP